MSNKKKFLKPVEIVLAALLAGSVLPATAAVVTQLAPATYTVSSNALSAALNQEPLLLKPAKMVKADYDDTYHSSHSSHSSHASHVSSSY